MHEQTNSPAVKIGVDVKLTLPPFIGAYTVGSYWPTITKMTTLLNGVERHISLALVLQQTDVILHSKGKYYCCVLAGKYENVI